MKTFSKSLPLGALVLLLAASTTAWAAESVIMFGLPHTPIGEGLISTEDGRLTVTPGEFDPELEIEPGTYGVSISLGEADSGIFGYLDTTSGILSEEGHFLMGQAYGQVNGLPDQLICSLSSSMISWMDGYFTLAADFGPLGASTMTYQVFDGPTLVATLNNAVDPIIISTYGESAPRANPFWKLPDGSIAAEVRLSCRQGIRLSGDADGEGYEYVYGDRIIIRPENVSAIVDFASRVDVTAGGDGDAIILTQERLGVFNHGHKVLGDALLDAANGELTIASLQPEDLSKELGVSIDLDHVRQFALKLQPQDLAANGATLMASAIGTYHQQPGGEFIGFAGVRNQEGTLQAFGEFLFFANGMQLSVLRNDCLVGKVRSPTPRVAVNLSGNPRVLGFDAAADTGLTRPGLAIRLDQLTTFSLPDGSTLEGDQIRFQAANSTSLDGVAAFSLVCSNLAGITIRAEGNAESLSLLDYFPEITAAGFLKNFSASHDGQAAAFIRMPSRSSLEGQPVVTFSDYYPGYTNAAFYSLQEDGLRFHGNMQNTLTLSSAAGLRVLPAQIVVGQSYFTMGSFNCHDEAANQDYAVEVSMSTKVAGFESLDLPLQISEAPAGALSALRLETVTTFAGSGLTNVPTARFSTNWLVAGIGVVKFSESEVFEGGVVRQQAGELAQFGILSGLAQTHLVNVGANVQLQCQVIAGGSAQILWQKDGVPIEGVYGSEFRLSNIQLANAGTYSAALSLLDGATVLATVVSDVADVQVIPFSDTPPFWAATGIGSSSYGITPYATVADNAGNTYVAGVVSGNLLVGTNIVGNTSSGSDVFLVKINAAGDVAWAKRVGGPYYDAGTTLGVDAAGNVYMSGTVGASAVIGSFNLNSWGVFMTKIDPAGNFLWVAHAPIAGNGSVGVERMAVDSAGNQYVLGSFYGTLTLTLDSTVLTPGGWDYDIFLTKLDASGHFLWAKQVSGVRHVRARAVVVDGANNLFLAGSVDGQATLAEGLTISSGSLYTSAGFLARADADGNFLWAKALGANVRNLALDSAGNVCLLGEFQNTVSLDGVVLGSRYQYSDAFLAKYAPAGNLLWGKLSPHVPDYSYAPLAVDSADNIYLAGRFYGQGTYNGTTFFMNSYESTVLTKLNANGQLLWHKQITGTSDNSPTVLARGGMGGEVYLTGVYRRQVTFGESNFNGPGSGQNLFVAKITGATAPTLTQQPQSQTVNLGDAATFTVAATGTQPFAYQWRKDGLDIAGATGASYTIAQVQWRDRGGYSVVVKNAGGIVVSESAALQVLAAEAGAVAFGATDFPLVETNALLLVPIVRTGNTSLVASVDFRAASGTATAGEDYADTVVTVQFAPGETLKNVAVPLLDDNVYEGTETVVLRLYNPGAGVTISQPDTATITITDNDPMGAPVIRMQPVSRMAPVGGTASFTVVVSGAQPLLYQWRKDGADLAGATNRILTLAGVQMSDAGLYSVVVHNDAGSVTSSDATLTVAPLPVIATQPQNQTVPYGESVTFSVVATSSYPYSTQTWTRAYSGTTDDYFHIPIPGSDTLYIYYDFLNDSDTIKVFGYNAGEPTFFGPTVTTNGTGLLVVNFDQWFNEVTIEVTAPPGGGDGWSYRVEKVVSPLTYRWIRQDATGARYDAGHGPTLTFNPVQFNQAGTYTVTVTDPVGSVTSDPFTLQVTGPLLLINPVPCPDGGNCCIQIIWHVGDYHLEMCEDLGTDEWYDVPNASSGMIIPVAESNTMYRLRRTERVD